MNQPIDSPRREVLWTAAMALVFAIVFVLVAVVSGNQNLPWRPYAYLLAAGLAGSLGAGLWLGTFWARWIGLFLIAFLCGTTILSLAYDHVSLMRFSLLFVLAFAGWHLWSLPLGEVVKHEKEDTVELLSMVLLLKEPMYLETSILAQLASIAWDSAVEAIDTDRDDAELGTAFDESSGSFVGGSSPHFVCCHPPALLAVHVGDDPYFDDVESLTADIPELRMRKAVEDHRAWLSVDVVTWMISPLDHRDAYRMISSLLAELADENCLAVLDAANGRIYVYDPDTERKLRSDDPIEQLRNPYYAPILSVNDEDPRILAAVAEARERWPEFVSAFENRSERNGSPFLVKAAFDDGDQTEFMWMEVTGIENGTIYGVLGNDPAYLSSIGKGDHVHVDQARLNDWVCPIRDQPMGGFTLKVLGVDGGSSDE